MKYVGRTKVGRAKTNPSTVLAIVRLPVELKDYAGKWAHIWRVDEDTVVIRFSDGKEVDYMPGVHFGAYYAVSNDIEERLRRLEMTVEELKGVIIGKKNDISSENNEIGCGCRDLNPGQRLGKPPSCH